MKPYIAITQYPPHTFGWAMAQLDAGNQVRRFSWPIEVEEYGTRIWRVYKISPVTMCKGFSNGVCGADNDSWGNLGTDSGCYKPSADDLVACDWQTLDSVTPQQIEIMNLPENRMVRTPNAAQLAFDAPRRGIFSGVLSIVPWLMLLVIGIVIYRYVND